MCGSGCGFDAVSIWIMDADNLLTASPTPETPTTASPTTISSTLDTLQPTALTTDPSTPSPTNPITILPTSSPTHLNIATSSPTAPLPVNVSMQRTAKVCSPGTWPNPSANEVGCPEGSVGTALPDNTPYRRTCHNPTTAFVLQPSNSSQALRCYSPSLDIGACVNNGMFNYHDAWETCMSLDAHDATDWRLPLTVAEAGAMCGSGCGFDASAIWMADPDNPFTASPTPSPTTASPTLAPTGSPTTDTPTAFGTTFSPTSTAPTASPTTISPTTAPKTLSPTSSSPTTLGPTTAPAPTAAVDVSVLSVVTFADLDITSFLNPAFNTTFRADFTTAMSEAANLPASSVTITSIESGSTAVASTVFFGAADIAAGADLSGFVGQLASEPGAIFEQTPLGVHGETTSTVRANSVPASSLSPTAGPTTTASTAAPTTTAPTVEMDSDVVRVYIEDNNKNIHVGVLVGAVIAAFIGGILAGTVYFFMLKKKSDENTAGNSLRNKPGFENPSYGVEASTGRGGPTPRGTPDGIRQSMDFGAV